MTHIPVDFATIIFKWYFDNMKHVSILITHNAIIAAIGNTQYMFSMVNDL